MDVQIEFQHLSRLVLAPAVRRIMKQKHSNSNSVIMLTTFYFVHLCQVMMNVCCNSKWFYNYKKVLHIRTGII